MPEFSIIPTPHEEAISLIRGKAVVTRTVFDGLLPELRGRAFTVTGIEDAATLQRIRDTIADLPQGSVWQEVKGNLVDELAPYLGDGAERRAELLLRTHAFQAFQASNWRVAQEDEDTTHLQYLATEDDNVRDSHLALNGLILPKDDPFWAKHFPPWEWGCRCRVRPMNPDFVAEAKAEDANRSPDDKLVMEGPALQRLRDGQLQRDGRTYDVTPPSDTNRETGFAWHPDDLRLPIDELRQRYDPEVFRVFETAMQAAPFDANRSVLDWLRTSSRAAVNRRIADPATNIARSVQPNPNAPRTPFVAAEERAAAIRAAKSKDDSGAAREAASQAFKPTPLPEADVALEKQRIKAEMAAEAAARETTGGEALPEVPAQFARSAQAAAQARAQYQDALAEIFARQALYYRQNPDALEAIRAWAGREIIALNRKRPGGNSARFT